MLIAAAALLFDWLLGEPRRRHPVVGFGQLALCCERRLYGGAGVAPGARRARGVCATLLLLAPFTAAAATLAEVPYLGTVVCVAVLYLALGHRSLHDHARPVAAALSAGDEAEARRLVASAAQPAAKGGHRCPLPHGRACWKTSQTYLKF